MCSMTRRLRYALLMVVAALSAGCATAPPLDTRGVNRAVTPAAAAHRPERFAGQRVLWAGTIVQARNLRDRTELEVLGYPLEANLGPDMSATAQGRFLVEKPGYLESVDYAPGREITVVGTLGGVREGKVGETPYRFPVVTAYQLYLWPPAAARRGSNVHFGVGVGVMVH
ncbi:MAG: Slp family lipoprotein [Gammaproteobacteria bacterium]